MLIKSTDDKNPHLDRLSALLSRDDVDNQQWANIEQEIRNCRAGMRGEQEACYEIDFHYGQSSNWAVIHDLRIEHDGRVAQIDHLIFNRMLECYVLETKHFSEGVAVNEHGEFVSFFKGKPRGIPSPIEQNHKHIAVLEKLLHSGLVQLPTRLGLRLVPKCQSLVLVSKNARINRPSTPLPGLSELVKADQLKARLDEDFEKGSVLKLVASETLKALANSLAAQHRPAKMTGPPRFGLSSLVSSPDTVAPGLDLASDPTPPTAAAVATVSSALPTCEKCTAAVTAAEARFCRLNKARFDNKILCRICQQPASTTLAASEPIPISAGADSPAVPAETASKYSCSRCSIAVPLQVARFCWMNKLKFASLVLCRDCQGTASLKP